MNRKQYQFLKDSKRLLEFYPEATVGYQEDTQKPTYIIGVHTISRLIRGESVELSTANLVPASDLENVFESLETQNSHELFLLLNPEPTETTP